MLDVKAIIRTLLRILGVNPILLGGALAGISALITKDKKRIGDILANRKISESPPAVGEGSNERCLSQIRH